jgi:hypothetical protein
VNDAIGDQLAVLDDIDGVADAGQYQRVEAGILIRP